MLLTEQEAATKWCPFARHGLGTEGVGINRLHGKPPETVDWFQCIGSRCMAWRWNGRDDGHAVATPRGHIQKTEAPGYCGLAGQVSA